MNDDFYTNLKFEVYLYGGLRILEYPEHKPKYELSWYNSFNLFDKLFLMVSLKWIGGITSNKKKLKDIVDIDFGMDYRFTRRLYASLILHNIAWSKKERYEGLNCNNVGVTMTAGFLW